MVMSTEAYNGSSPHERGTGHQAVIGLAQARFIPARAGNRIGAKAVAAVQAVHPRTSGEQGGGVEMALPDAGSSPHERGTERTETHRTAARRFIPARAGNSRQPHAARRSHAVHPRTSGEQARASTDPGRITVHPRTSGEQDAPIRANREIAGSSPHERGTGSRQHHGGAVLRFIPARAGNSSQARKHCSESAVHPRTSGEQVHAVCCPPPFCGSSPHERGTGSLRRVRNPLVRFIPARAGNRRPHRPATSALPVHPRTSGEQAKVIPANPDAIGSSPHERGTDFLHLHETKWKNGVLQFYRRFLMPLGFSSC